MFSIVKKRKLDQLLEDNENLHKKNQDLCYQVSRTKTDIATLTTEKSELLKVNQELSEELERLNSVYADQSSVVLQIADDIQSINPVVRYNPDITEKLIELSYLQDGKESKHAIQLALMIIAHEALEQVIEQFAQPQEVD